MVITYRTSNKIRFPVFKIPSDNWSRSDGLLFLDNKILDDTNMDGATLGERRLESPHKGLVPLNKMVEDHSGILKQKKLTFIDSYGLPFIYEKTKFVRLKYHAIKEIRKKERACLLFIHKHRLPFIIPRPPGEGMGYAGILHLYDIPWLLYEYAEGPKMETKRKV